MRKKSRILVLLSWIHDLLLFEGIYVLAAAIQNRKGTEVTLLLLEGLSLLLPVILSYIVICRCRNLWIFLLVSLAAAWGMMTVSNSLLAGCLTAFIFLFRCYVRIKQGEIRRKMKELPNTAGAQEDKEVWEVPTLLDTPRVFHCMLFVVLYLGVLYFRRYTLLLLMLGILAAEFCVCLAYCYLERLEEFIKNNIRVANLPAGTMKRIGTGILLTGITGLLLFFLPAAVYHKEPLSDLRFSSTDMNGEITEFYREHTGPNDMLEGLMQLNAQAKEPPKWLETISEILSYLILLLIAYLAFRFIFTVIRKAMESFSDADEDEIIFLKKETDSKEGIKNLLKRTQKEEFLSPERKIRRLYKKLIKRTLKKTPYDNETPLELEIRAGLYEKENRKARQIHELYEKARYGQEVCTKEDAKQYAEICSEWNR